MKPHVLAITACLFLAGWTWSQDAAAPRAEQARQIQRMLESGAPLTPEMIEAAKQYSAQYPEQGNTTGSPAPKKNGSSDQTSATPAPIKTEPVSPLSPAPVTPRPSSQALEAGSGTGRFPAELTRFGHNFFRNAGAESTDGMTAPSLPEYILSPGDEIRVFTWGRGSETQTVVIDNEGMFHYPTLQPLRLAGLRFAAAQKLITTEVQKIHGMTASVGLGKLRSIRVMVLGEAVNPGTYTVPAGVTVTGAIFRSGGVSPIGSLRGIEVRRNGRTAATLDLYDMLLRGENRGDIQLLPGDVLFIPLARTQVAIHGMVKRPAVYEAKTGLRALEAIQLAGGLESSAFKGRVRLDRVQNNKRRVVLDVDMEKMGPANNVVLQDGDILYVDRVLDRLDEAVSLEGNVHRPGRYQYRPGMTVRDLIPTLQDLKPETFFEYAHIRRPAPDDDRPILLNFSLAGVFADGARVPLQPRDVVVVYSRFDVVEQPTVTVSGTVRRPGTYPYGEAMTVADLIILGGGLGDAHLQEAHVLRALPAGSEDSLYTRLLRVSLKDALENRAGSDNLVLQPFDELVVFSRREFNLPKSVGVYGSVRNEGTFELSEGMGIPDLVKRAGGFTKNSFKLGIEVGRRTVVKDSVYTRQILKMSLKDLLDSAASFKLQDGDRVYVREVVNSREYASITLEGEFAFPGRYELMPGEKLSSVIRRAGGFTTGAYLRGAVFLRQSVKEQQLRHAEEIGRRLEGQLQARLESTTQESERANIELAMKRREKLLTEISRAPYLGRVVIQIDSDLRFTGTDWDLELEDGDVLKVGPRVSTVSVLGEVYSPTTVVHSRKTNQVGEILAKAGGVNAYGDYSETFYVAPDGSVSTPHTTPWYSSFRCKDVETGGTIIVPLKPPAKDHLEVWVDATQILYQIAISVGVAKMMF